MRPNDIRARSAQLGARRNESRGFQLGPRIRVGGTLGHVGQNVKTAVVKGYKDTGHAIGDAANNNAVKAAIAAGLFATGAGAPLGAAIMGGTGLVGGALHRGGGLHDALTEGAKGAVIGGVTGGAGKAVGGASGILSHAKKVMGFGGGDGEGMTEDQFYASTPGSSTYTGDGGGGLGSAVVRGAKKVGGALTGGGDTGGGRGGLVDKLLLGGTMAASAADAKRKRDLENRAIDYSTKSFDSRAPLRAQGMAQLQDQSTPDLSDIFSDPGNVYSRRQLGSKVPASSASYAY